MPKAIYVKNKTTEVRKQHCWGKKEKKWKKARIYARNECTKDVLWQKWICPLFPLLKSLYEKITRLYVPRILLKIYETRARSAFFTRLPPGDIWNFHHNISGISSSNSLFQIKFLNLISREVCYHFVILGSHIAKKWLLIFTL